METRRITAFEVIRLNDQSERSWAVVEKPSGAIATDAEGRLIMRLSESEARQLAANMTLSLSK